MKIRFNKLIIHGFKSYLKETIIEFGEKATIIEGRNGSGKSTIGEAITWVLYGTDIVGNSLDPTNIFSRQDIEARLIVVNEENKQLEFTRSVRGGKNKFYLNEVPVKATEYKETVEGLFAKDEFLTLFNPLYFFTQHWTSQRAQLLKYIKEPLNKTVLDMLPQFGAKALAEELKQLTLEKIEAKHRELKKQTEQDMIRLRERINTLEGLNAPGSESHANLNELQRELKEIQLQILECEQQRKEYEKAHKEHEALVSKANHLYEQIQAQVKVVEHLQAQAFETHCGACGQELKEEAKAQAEQNKVAALAKAKMRGKQIVEERKAVMEQLKQVTVPQAPPNVVKLQERAMHLQSELAKHNKPDYSQQIEQTKDELLKVKMKHIDSVQLVDAVTQFKAEKANVMVHEVNNLFENINVILYETLKNGEQKATFEIEWHNKPFSKLSNAEKIKCGMEFREAYMNLCEKDVPMIIDNFESISGECRTMGQVVTMAVKDKELDIKKA